MTGCWSRGRPAGLPEDCLGQRRSFYTGDLTPSSPQPNKVDMLGPILQMKRLGLGKVIGLGHGFYQ